jgi:hypothetical protein
MVIPETTSSRPETSVQEKQATDFWLSQIHRQKIEKPH